MFPDPSGGLCLLLFDSLYVYDERLDTYIPGADGPERMILALPNIR